MCGITELGLVVWDVNLTGGLGCQSAGVVTGERVWVLSFTELGLVVWDVSLIGGLGCQFDWWFGMSVSWSCYR